MSIGAFALLQQHASHRRIEITPETVGICRTRVVVTAGIHQCGELVKGLRTETAERIAFQDVGILPCKHQQSLLVISRQDITIGIGAGIDARKEHCKLVHLPRSQQSAQQYVGTHAVVGTGIPQTRHIHQQRFVACSAGQYVVLFMLLGALQKRDHARHTALDPRFMAGRMQQYAHIFLGQNRISLPQEGIRYTAHRTERISER